MGKTTKQSFCFLLVDVQKDNSNIMQQLVFAAPSGQNIFNVR